MVSNMAGICSIYGMSSESHWRTPSFFKMVKTTNQWFIICNGKLNQCHFLGGHQWHGKANKNNRSTILGMVPDLFHYVSRSHSMNIWRNISTHHRSSLFHILKMIVFMWETRNGGIPKSSILYNWIFRFSIINQPFWK